MSTTVDPRMFVTAESSDGTAPLAPSVTSAIAFALFIVLNGVMFLRPPELLPQLADLPIYEFVIGLCTLMALPALAAKLRPSSLAQNTITICVFGMLGAIVLSHLTHGNTWDAQDRGVDYAKTILYFLLLVSLVDSSRRLSVFLIALLVFTLTLSTIALLSYHRLLQLSTVSPYAEGQFSTDLTTGIRSVVVRLQAMGVYGNPNALSRAVAIGMTIALYGLMTSRRWLMRVAYTLAFIVLGHAIQLTYSRGGLLGLIAGLLILFHARYGMRRGGMVILMLLPLLTLFSGRQMDIDTSSGTGQLRIQLWSNGLVAMRSAPVFGIGAGFYKRTAGNDAHNSFIEAFVETGIVGGTIFTSAFYIAIRGLYQSKSDMMTVLDPALEQMRPYVLAVVVGTVVGQFSSSRAYFPMTYMVLGLAMSYLALADRYVPLDLLRLSPRLATKLAALGVGTLAFLHLYTKFNAHF